MADDDSDRETRPARVHSTPPTLDGSLSGELRSDCDDELRALFAFSLEMLCIAGTDGYFKRVNPAFERTLGYSTEEILSRPLVSFVHADDREKTQHEIQRLAQGQSVVRFENRYVCKDGSIRWLSWMAAPGPVRTRIYASAADVTEQKRAESRFRMLHESAPDATLLVDRRGRIVVANAMSEQVFGYRREDLLGQSVEMLMPERYRRRHEHLRAMFVMSPEFRGMKSRPELTAMRKDGTEFPAEINLSPIQVDEDLLTACAIRDISDRKKAEQALRENRVQMLAAQRIQQYILPRAAPNLAGYDIAGGSKPAEFTAGDYFDYLAMPDNSVGLVIGDVSGHGFPSALLMASTSAHLRSIAETGVDLGEMLTRTNRALSKETEDDRFVTLLVGRLDPEARTLQYINAGHPPACVLDAAGEVKARLTGDQLPVGIFPDTGYQTSGCVTLAPGDLVLLLTDGVPESVSPDDAPFGIELALDVVRRARRQPAAEIVQALFDAVENFCRDRPQEDDITAMIVKVE